MSTIQKSIALVFICAALISLYIFSFSLKAVLTLATLWSLIIFQIFFLYRRTKIERYKSSDYGEKSTVSNEGKSHNTKPEIKAETEFAEIHNFKEKHKVATEEFKETSQIIDHKNQHFQDEHKAAINDYPSFENAPLSSESIRDDHPVQKIQSPKSNSKTKVDSNQAPKKATAKKQSFDEKFESFIITIQDCLEQKQYKKALSLTDQFLEEKNYTFNNIDQIITLLKLKGDCEFYLKNHGKASEIWLLLFNKNYLNPGHPRFFIILEDIIEKSLKHNLDGALYFLLILLNQHRQSENLEKMDHTYYKLEAIYRKNNDHDHLIKIYQSHIAVKEKLEDIVGQLPLLDSLGKLYYTKDNAENSQKCYEQRMILEKQLEEENLVSVE